MVSYGRTSASRRERTHFAPVPCEGCGTLFEPVREWQRNCSDRCRAKAYRQHQVKLAETGRARFDRAVQELIASVDGMTTRQKPVDC
jgi:hypothetical protein